MHNCETSPLVVTVDLDLGLGRLQKQDWTEVLPCYVQKQIPADAAE